MKRAYFVVCFLAVLASFAAAQSIISGVVKDTSGAAPARAKLEAASDVLIQSVSTAIIYGEGRCAIIDLSVFGSVKNLT